MVLQIESRVTVAVTDRFPDIRRLVCLYAGPAHLQINQAAYKQSVITHLLGIEPKARPASVEPVSRVFGEHFRRHGCVALKRLRHDKLLDKPLHIPARCPEISGQPVEQLWMAWRLALRPEVIACFDESRAKE